MVASWGVGVLVALYTLAALLGARHGQRRGGVSLKMLTNWCALFTVGLVTATTVSLGDGDRDVYQTKLDGNFNERNCGRFKK